MGLRELIFGITLSSHLDETTITTKLGSIETSYDQIQELEEEIPKLKKAIEDPNNNEQLLKRLLSFYEPKPTNKYRLKKSQVKAMYKGLTGTEFPNDLRMKYSKKEGYHPQRNLLTIRRFNPDKEQALIITLNHLGFMSAYSSRFNLDNESEQLILFTAANLFEWAYSSLSDSALKKEIETHRERTIYNCDTNDISFEAWLLADGITSVSNNNPGRAYNNLLTGDFDINEAFKRSERVGLAYCEHHKLSAQLFRNLLNK